MHPEIHFIGFRFCWTDNGSRWDTLEHQRCGPQLIDFLIRFNLIFTLLTIYKRRKRFLSARERDARSGREPEKEGTRDRLKWKKTWQKKEESDADKDCDNLKRFFFLLFKSVDWCLFHLKRLCVRAVFFLCCFIFGNGSKCTQKQSKVYIYLLMANKSWKCLRTMDWSKPFIFHSRE